MSTPKSSQRIARGKTTPASNAGSFKTYAHGAPDIDLDATLDAGAVPACGCMTEPDPANPEGPEKVLTHSAGCRLHPEHIEPAEDDLDFARETLGPFATDEQVRDLAEQRADRDAKERAREAKIEQIRARLAATDYPQDEDPLAEARAESAAEDRLRRYAEAGLPQTPNLSCYEEVDDIERRWRGGFGVSTAHRLTNDDLAAYAKQVLATHRVPGDKPSDVHLRALYADLQSAVDRYATNGLGTGAPKDPDALGGEIIDALQTIADQRVTNEVTTYGADSAVFDEWAKIHDDYKSTDEDGVRRVMSYDRKSGTVLTPWRGPKVLADYRERHVEETEAVETALHEFHRARAAGEKGDLLAKNRFLLAHGWTQDEVDQIWDTGSADPSNERIGGRLDIAMEKTMRQDIEDAKDRGLPVEQMRREFNIAIGRPWDN